MKTSSMKNKRLDEIFEFVSKNGSCSYPELIEKFGVSMPTMRRDINILEAEGKIEKVYGGIKVKQILSFSNTSSSLKNLFSPQKESFLNVIGEKAARLVNDGDVLIMGSGYTVASMMSYLAEKKDITIITNSLLIIFATIEYNIKTHFIGGDLRTSTFSTIGFQTIDEFKNIQANKAFISCNGVTLKGFSNATEMEANIKKSIIQISNETIMLADSKKFDRIGLYNFASPNEINYLVTDNKPENKFLDAFQPLGMKIIY